MWETTRLNQQGPRHRSDFFLLRSITYKKKKCNHKSGTDCCRRDPECDQYSNKKHVMTIGNGQEKKDVFD